MKSHLWYDITPVLSQLATIIYDPGRNDFRRWAVFPCSTPISKYLTPSDRDEMATILKFIVLCNCIVFPFRFLWNLFPNLQQKSIIAANNGLSLIKRQAIIWTDDGNIYWRIYASLVSCELNKPMGVRLIAPWIGKYLANLLSSASIYTWTLRKPLALRSLCFHSNARIWTLWSS